MSFCMSGTGIKPSKIVHGKLNFHIEITRANLCGKSSRAISRSTFRGLTRLTRPTFEGGRAAYRMGSWGRRVFVVVQKLCLSQ